MDKELCVRCGKETPYQVSTPITSRLYFVEGAGQLCSDCYHKLWAREEKILPEGERKQMIKTITVPTWEEIQDKIQAFPKEEKKQYEGLKETYEKETQSSHPNHELIASLMKEANELCGPALSLTKMPHTKA